MKKNRLTIVLFILLATATAFVTPRIPDILIYEGKEFPIQNGNP
jgi:hypothetical protein